MVTADAIMEGVTSARSSRAVANPADRVTRAIDIVVCLIALAILLPFAVIFAVAIKLQDGGPILFGHMRIGRDGRLFRCWKFRSMVVNAEQKLAALLARDPEARAEWEADHKLRNDPRITGLGHFLRKSSIDELPQLINVLRGEMSLVGPRPVVQAEALRYGRYFREYCAVRPGITGLWQVMGRNDVSYRRRVALDVAFVRSQSVSLYLTILVLTVPAVFGRSGVY
jgi:lipopolysaccharide/colanic/teichoic acid biosynthesis glycosyltransferase